MFTRKSHIYKIWLSTIVPSTSPEESLLTCIKKKKKRVLKVELEYRVNVECKIFQCRVNNFGRLFWRNEQGY